MVGMHDKQAELPYFAVIASCANDNIPLKRHENDHPSNDLIVQMVAEFACAYEEWLLIPQRAYLPKVPHRVHGRRKGDTVELFHAPGRPELPHLRQQYERLGFTVVTTQYPANDLDLYTIEIAKRLHTDVLEHTQWDMYFGLIGGDPDTGRLFAIYASRDQMIELLAKWNISFTLTTIGHTHVTLGTVVANDVVLYAPESMCRPYFSKTNGSLSELNFLITDTSEFPQHQYDQLKTKMALTKQNAAIKAKEATAAKKCSAKKKKVGEAAMGKKRAYSLRKKAKKKAATTETITDKTGNSDKHIEEQLGAECDTSGNTIPDLDGQPVLGGSLKLPGDQVVSYTTVQQLAIQVLQEHDDIARSLGFTPANEKKRE